LGPVAIHGSTSSVKRIPSIHSFDRFAQNISSANAKRFGSDASIYTVLEDSYGNVLNIGRKSRTVNTPLRRA
jgi:hypothetical protein